MQLISVTESPLMTPPSTDQLATLHDQELTDLATLWRKQAAHGVRPAFGVAHALEVECRRRLRERGAQGHGLQAASACMAQQASRHWWSWR